MTSTDHPADNRPATEPADAPITTNGPCEPFVRDVRRTNLTAVLADWTSQEIAIDLHSRHPSRLDDVELAADLAVGLGVRVQYRWGRLRTRITGDLLAESVAIVLPDRLPTDEDRRLLATTDSPLSTVLAEYDPRHHVQQCEPMTGQDVDGLGYALLNRTVLDIDGIPVAWIEERVYAGFLDHHESTTTA